MSRNQQDKTRTERYRCNDHSETFSQQIRDNPPRHDHKLKIFSDIVSRGGERVHSTWDDSWIPFKQTESLGTRDYIWTEGGTKTYTGQRQQRIRTATGSSIICEATPEQINKISERHKWVMSYVPIDLSVLVDGEDGLGDGVSVNRSRNLRR